MGNHYWGVGLRRNILDIRLAGVLFIILLGSVALIRAENLGVVAEQSKPSCGCCDYSDVEVLDVRVLEGEERAKALATALSSQDYKNLKKVLEEKGYSPSINDATAQITNMDVSGTEYEVLTVYVPFEGKAEFTASIVFSTLEGHTMAVSIIINHQDETMSFSTISVDGEVIEIPLKGNGGVHPLAPECEYDWQCEEMYGPDWCCNWDYQCEYCGPPSPPPEYSNCWFCLFLCELAIDLGCGVPALVCLKFAPYFAAACAALCGGNPTCIAACVLFLELMCAAMIGSICEYIIEHGLGVSCEQLCIDLGWCPP